MTQPLSGSSLLDYTVRMFYADLVEDACLRRADVDDVYEQVRRSSWLFHQLEVAGSSTSLVSGFHVLGSDGGLVVRDLRTDEELAMLDLGLSAAVGDWLLGRVLPVGLAPALIFDLQPVVVDEQTACEVARSHELGEWVAAVKSALVEGRVRRTAFELPDPAAAAA